MARKRIPKTRDTGKRVRKKVCMFCKERVDWVDYKDVNLLRRFLSDRAKIRARRVTGNCAQHQRDVSIAIKTARELALLPYTSRVTTTRGAGRGGGPPSRRDDAGPSSTPPPPPPARPSVPPPSAEGSDEGAGDGGPGEDAEPDTAAPESADEREE